MSKIKNAREAHAAIRRLAEAKEEQQRLEDEIANLQTDLIPYLERVKEDVVVMRTKDTEIKPTVVRGSRVIINEARLKRSVGSSVWNKITKRVLDKDRLEQKVASGEVEAAVVGECSDVLDNKPYIRLTERKREPVSRITEQKRNRRKAK